MKANDLEQIIFEAESWIGRLKALRVKHEPKADQWSKEELKDIGLMTLKANPLKLNELSGFRSGQIGGINFIDSASNKAAIEAALMDAMQAGTGMYSISHKDDEIRIDTIRTPDIQSFPFDQPSTGYTAVDMATAAADGFRDGRASVVVELPKPWVEPIGLGRVVAYASVVDAIEDAGGTVKA